MWEMFKDFVNAAALFNEKHPVKSYLHYLFDILPVIVKKINLFWQRYYKDVAS